MSEARRRVYHQSDPAPPRLMLSVASSTSGARVLRARMYWCREYQAALTLVKKLLLMVLVHWTLAMVTALSSVELASRTFQRLALRWSQL